MSYFSVRHFKKIACLFLLGLSVSLLLWADSSATSTAKRAEKLFYEELYGDALPLYSQLFNWTSDSELKVQWALRLAACHLEEGQPQTTLSILSSVETPFRLDQRLFLMSRAYRQLGHSPQALDALKQCPLPQSHHSQNLLHLEQGYHFMQIQDFENAQRIFKTISWEMNNPLPHELAQIQLAKIALINHQFHEALLILSFASSFPQEHILNIERVYLRGWALLSLQQYSQAAFCFETLLPKARTSPASWPIQVLNGLIISYLRQALTLDQTNIDQLKALFSKTQEALQPLFTRAPNEKAYLLLTDFYLIKAKCLSDAQSYAQAQQLLDKSELFSSPEGIRQVLLKRAAAAPSYEERSHLYEQLLSQVNDLPDFNAKIWFFKGLNDLEEGLRKQKQQKFTEETQPFEHAVYAFNQVLQKEKALSLIQTARTIKYLALAYAHLPEALHAEKAWQFLNQLIANPALLDTLEYPEEMYCLAAWIALRLTDKDILQKAKVLLQQGQKKKEFSPSWHERCLKLAGMICLQLGEWQEADLIFEKILQNELYVSSHGEAWFWRAYSANQRQDIALKKEYLQQAYMQDPRNPYAPIAYFQLYSYREYMQGNRKAIKHLQAMPLLFAPHPLFVNAYYLIGLNHKKDRLSEDGHLLRRKDWIAAIDAFQLAESTFDTLFDKNMISAIDLSYFIQLRYQAQLERAQANLAIAQHATGGKREIYLEYAEEVFKQLIQDFTDSKALANQALVRAIAPYPNIWAEAEFQLAKTLEEKNQWKEAEEVLNTSLEHYRQAQITQGHGLMHAWYAKGKLALQQENQKFSLHCFLEAEKATRHDLGLSPNEKLDLWIQQSLCYKTLNQLDEAMRLLSRVINDDVISPLRIKAMFLRAEIYELQGRPELAIKQLEATARKGGEWSQKAKEKLEHVYGYEFAASSDFR